MKPGELIQVSVKTWGIPKGTLGIVLEHYFDPSFGHILKILLPTGEITDVHESRAEYL